MTALPRLRPPASDDVLKTLSSSISAMSVLKSRVGWNLEELEAMVLLDDEKRSSDSDDESEGEVELMLPAQI